ncbi:hypothetical protein [Hufsiella ginkgonis]|uniref:Uncharacterized protein n=1 Tax=Hufsiella ginkgonis TaxID=2695274 RepID=A0A7K1XZT3_9SPHI|nr:hypothetical protein [Hufsiella ginkgonis]MXV16327.1 hypothetical protein [Hufsiella ginkgonis]
MKIIKYALILASLNSFAQTSTTKVNVGVIYPVSSNGSHAPLDTNHFSLNLIGGVSAGEQGLVFAGLSNVVHHDAKGLQFAGFSNHIGGKADGMAFAGFANTYAEGRGFQFAGFTNVASGNVNGGQFAGFLNKCADIKGAQFAGFANVAGNAEGLQFAGFINTAVKVTGSQFAGFANAARQDITGSQFAGFVNTARNVAGSQFAGFINVAKKVKGAQFSGFINVADSSDCPVGILNLIKNGEKSIAFTIDENQTALVTFRSGGKMMYGILGGGYNFNNEEEKYAFEAGFGAHFFESNFFRLNIEASSMLLEDFRHGETFNSSLRMMPALKFGDHLELIGGPALHYVNSNTEEGRKLSDHYIDSWTNRWSHNFQGFYIGYTAGLNIIF